MHIYTQGENKYPSVTTIIKMISTNEELMKWANYMGFCHKDITKIQNETAEFGTMVHSNIQGIVDPNFTDIIKPKDPIEEYRLTKVLNLFRGYYKDIEYNTIFSEKTIISPTLGYAGTLDWLAEFNTGYALIDFKTSKKVRKYMLLQLGGYYNLLRDQHPDIADKITFSGINIINENECNLYPIGLDKLKACGDAFNMLFELYRRYEKITVGIDKKILTTIKNKSSNPEIKIIERNDISA